MIFGEAADMGDVADVMRDIVSAEAAAASIERREAAARDEAKFQRDMARRSIRNLSIIS
jgi:hypothetical protein